MANITKKEVNAMLRRFLMDQGGATILEYVVGGVLALGILGTCVWALMKAMAR